MYDADLVDAGSLGVACGLTRDLFAVRANVVRGDVGIKLADGGEGDVTHGGVGELRGENAEAGSSRRIVLAGDDLGEHLAAEAGDIRGLLATVGLGYSLPADDIEGTDGNAVASAHRIVARVLVQQAGKKPGGEIGAVCLVE